jgi:hypothetical protein
MTSRGNVLTEGVERKWAFLMLMKPKIVTWNVRGLNALNKRLKIRGLLRELKVDTVCLLEMKTEIIIRVVIQSL